MPSGTPPTTSTKLAAPIAAASSIARALSSMAAWRSACAACVKYVERQ
jgi:hypothetical protein